MHCGPPIQHFGWVAAYHAAPPMGSGECCKLPQLGAGRSPDRSRILVYCMLAKRIWLQHFWFFGQHCNEWQNERQSKLTSNLHMVSAGNLFHINIIVVQTEKLIFVGSKTAAPPPPLNFAAVWPNTSNMPKADPVNETVYGWTTLHGNTHSA